MRPRTTPQRHYYAAALTARRYAAPYAGHVRESRVHGDGVSTIHDLIDVAIVCFLALAIVLLLCVSSSLLTNFHIHYVTSGGIFLEKVHAATYLVFLAFALQLLRHGNPVRAFLSRLSGIKLTLVLLLVWLALFAQLVFLKRPFTPIIDTFLLPPMIYIVMQPLSRQEKQILALVFHAGILLNVALGYYEYFSGHRLIPLTVGNIVVFGEWRSAALLGHPLTASGLIAAYVIALIIRPSILPSFVRLPIIAVCFPSLMVFGGRTALLTAIVVVGILCCAEGVRLLRGKKTALPVVILSLCLISAAVAMIAVAAGTGVFDKMLLRFSSDKGSALARFATINFLSYLDGNELIFGADPTRITSLQSQLGLNYGIENFWISSVAQFGVVLAALVTVGILCFLEDLRRQAHSGIWAIFLLLMMIAASSVSFSSKNIQLAQFIVLITLLLPKDQKLPALVRTRNPAAYRAIPLPVR